MQYAGMMRRLKAKLLDKSVGGQPPVDAMVIQNDGINVG